MAIKVRFNVQQENLVFQGYIKEFDTDALADTFIQEFRASGKYFTLPTGKRVFISPSSFYSAEEL